MTKRNVIIAVVTLAVAGAGCAVLFGKKQEFRFSHQKHLGLDIECGACHKKAETSDEAGMPNKKMCMTCHEGIDAEKPPEKKIDQLFDGDALKWKSVFAISDEVKFSHKTHVEHEVACDECHKEMKLNTNIDELESLKMKDCLACHAEKKAPEKCETCHKEIRQDVPPTSHKVSWKKMHGKVVRAGDDFSSSECALCHRESTCTTCHRDEKPDNHTEFWRQRGHGIVAGIDRDSCKACHQSAFCTECHESVTPRSHAGSWFAPRANHCLSCKEPVGAQNCVVCHKGTPSHDSAPTQPSWHQPGFNCRLCHVGTNAPPHVDDGVTQCQSCHK